MSNTRIQLSALSAVLLCVSAPALAADLDLAPQHNSWTGWYAGAAVGAGGAVAEVSSPLLGGISLDGIGAEGVLGSVFVGYDYQVSQDYVVGIMADYTFSNIETTLNVPAAPASIDATFDGAWAIMGRFGYLAGPNTLTYVLAGYGEQELDISTTGLGGLGITLDTGGYIVGSGIEHRFDNNWSARVEYRYAHTDDSVIPGFLDLDLTAHTVRVGLAYRMGNDNGIRPARDAQEVNWTGFYVGAGSGGISTNGEINVPGLLTFDGLGGEGSQIGIHVGYDHHIAGTDWVVGLEARARHNFGELSLDAGGANIANIEENTEFSVTARAGWLASSDTMFYGLVGYSTTEYELNVPIIPFNLDVDFDGWTIGGGIEHAIKSNWTARLEYRFTQYGDEDFLGGALSLEPSSHAAMASFSYKFN